MSCDFRLIIVMAMNIFRFHVHYMHLLSYKEFQVENDLLSIDLLMFI